MIKKLSKEQRFLLLEALESSNYRELIRMLRGNVGVHDLEFENSKCKCEHREMCDYCVNLLEGIFCKIGWVVPDSHYVIGIRKPTDLIKSLITDVNHWFNKVFRKEKNWTYRRTIGNINPDYSESYCEVHDSQYVDDSREWIEEKCEDVDCEYCRDRPKHHRKNCRCLNK